MDQKVPEKRQRISTLGQIGLQQFAPYLMNRIMGRYNATLRDDLRKQNLTIPQVRALAVLSVMDGVTVNDLSVYTVIEQSTMSRTLDTLVAQGLVRREQADADSRVRRVFLTDEGRTEFGRAWPAMHDGFETMFDGIDDAEYAAIGTCTRCCATCAGDLNRAPPLGRGERDFDGRTVAVKVKAAA